MTAADEGNRYVGTTSEFQEQMRPLLELTPAAQLSETEKKGEYKDKVEIYAKTGGRLALPEEVAGVIAMLCSKEAGYCTGSVVCANGGMVFGLS
jgi:3-oxoacyl-[acyl-carrier protein] reductase